MKKARTILELIGETPVVKLNRIPTPTCAEIWLKLEMLNPGGSIKDRAALAMIDAAEKSGKLKKNSILVEPTCGNCATSLAMVAAALGYKLIVTMPENAPAERLRMIRAFGAEVISTPQSECMPGAMNKALELINENPRYVMLSQFNNPANPQVHSDTTAKEILEQFGDKLAAFIAGVGTGGTITGVGRELKKALKHILVIAVEPEASAVLSGKPAQTHKIAGIGAGFIPENLDTKVYDEIIKVPDDAAIKLCLRLVKEEGIMAGLSTGAVTYAAMKIARRIGKGKQVLAIAADSIERYIASEQFAEL